MPSLSHNTFSLEQSLTFGRVQEIDGDEDSGAFNRSFGDGLEWRGKDNTKTSTTLGDVIFHAPLKMRSLPVGTLGKVAAHNAAVRVKRTR